MNTTKYLYIILNDTSGRGEAKNIQAILDSLENQFDFQAIIRKTEYKKHANILAEELALEAQDCPGQPILVAMGGDGTLSEVIDGLKEKHLDLPVAFIPYGSGNDFARSNKIPFKPLDAILYLLTREAPIYRDVLKYEDHLRSDTHYAINSVGIGLDGRVVHEKNKAAKDKKNRALQFNKLGYLTSLFGAYKKQPPFDITLQTKEQERHFKNAILVLNANYPYAGGGMHLVPDATAEDGLIDFVVVEKLSGRELLHLVALLLKGKGEHLFMPKVHTLKLDTYRVSISTRQYGHADGEELDEALHSYTFSSFKRSFWI